MNRLFLLGVLVVFLLSCQQKEPCDQIFYNAKIYTLDKDSLIADAMAVLNGRIVAVGKKDDLLKKYQAKERTDLNGNTVYPGFIDAHCHFYGYGINLSEADLSGTDSWQAVLDTIINFAIKNPEGWLVGRGWDQNDWADKSFPSKKQLDSLFPGRPVFLQRVDGHACIVNQKALDQANINASTKIIGGEIVLIDGSPSGLLLDNAMDALQRSMPVPSDAVIKVALLKAQSNCLAVGLTTVSDAGLLKNVVTIIDSLHRNTLLKIRVYAMLADNDENKNFFFSTGPYKTDRLTVRAIKYYADGALGSRGALLLKPYSDAPATRGLQLNSRSYFEEQAMLCNKHGFQMCTHAIGDSANRMILQVYGKILGGINDKRWRIEHSQVIAPDDFELFHRYSIIPSVQPTHATSDMYWAMDRLGVFRIRGAYAYRDLLSQNGWLANGSDFPVESINPLFGFYAAVARKDQNNFPEGGFEMKNALTRMEALKAMTIWAAAANFEDEVKGSIEIGKVADFVVLDRDIMTVAEEDLFKATVEATYINGEKVFDR
ncbi:MAG: amidohydrolase [Chitinophagales bacterium]|nr:amidohydrolase [Chitinophagales bacterium]